jgi:peptidyl-prolyl cis-trans isomerase D
MKKYYQEHLENFRIPERVTIRQILLKADPNNKEQIEKAKKKAEDLIKEIKAGGDFVKIAQKNSEDVATAPVGGIMANIGRKQTVPEFEKVAFSLKQDEISGPVQTVFGIHIIKGLTHEQAHLESFEEAKIRIRPMALEQATTAELSNLSEKASQELSKNPAAIAAVAEKYHGTVLSPAPLSQSESVPGVNGSTAALVQEIFVLEKGKSGSPAVAGDGFGVPLLDDIISAHPAVLGEVKESVKTDYITEQAKARAADKAAALGKLLEQQPKKDLQAIAKSGGVSVKTSPAVNRDGAIPSFGNAKDLDAKTFDSPVGSVFGPTNLQGIYAIYQVKSKEPANEAEFSAKETQIREQLLETRRRLAFEVFQDSLKKRLTSSGDLKLHEDVIAHITNANKPQ